MSIVTGHSRAKFSEVRFYDIAFNTISNSGHNIYRTDSSGERIKGLL